MRWWTFAALAMGLLAAGDARVPSKNVKSAERTLAILVALSAEAMTFMELQRWLHYPRASLHGLLGTLERLGWIRRGKDGRYRLMRQLLPTSEAEAEQQLV